MQALFKITMMVLILLSSTAFARDCSTADYYASDSDFKSTMAKFFKDYPSRYSKKAEFDFAMDHYRKQGLAKGACRPTYNVGEDQVFDISSISTIESGATTVSSSNTTANSTSSTNSPSVTDTDANAGGPTKTDQKHAQFDRSKDGVYKGIRDRDLPHTGDMTGSNCETLYFPGMAGDERDRCLKALRAQRYTHIYVHPYSEVKKKYDYLSKPKDMTKYFNEIIGIGDSTGKQPKIRGILFPVIWLIPENAPKLHAEIKSDLAGFKKKLTAFVKASSVYATSYVVGRNLDKNFTKEEVDAIGKHLKSITKKQLAVHQSAGKSDYATLDWVDYHIHSFAGTTEEEVTAELKQVLSSTGKPVVAGDFPGETANSALAAAVIAGGASGFGSGGSVAGVNLAIIKQRTGDGNGAPDDFDISKVKWHVHTAAGTTDMSKWRKTGRITSIKMSRREICIDHTTKGTWPVDGKSASHTGVEGNPWVIVKRNGEWHGATYEWLRPGQVCKFTTAHDAYRALGPHIKLAPLNSWLPRNGETIGFMISSLARSGPAPRGRAAQERTNIQFIKVGANGGKTQYFTEEESAGTHKYLEDAIGKSIIWNRGWDQKVGRPEIDPKVVIKNFKALPDKLTYSGIPLRHWGLQKYFNSHLAIYAKAVIMIDRGTYVEGGAFEWSLNNQNWMGLANIKSPKTGKRSSGWVKAWTPPPRGTPVWFFLMSDDGRYSSNPISFKWP